MLQDAGLQVLQPEQIDVGLVFDSREVPPLLLLNFCEAGLDLLELGDNLPYELGNVCLAACGGAGGRLSVGHGDETEWITASLVFGLRDCTGNRRMAILTWTMLRLECRVWVSRGLVIMSQMRGGTYLSL